MRLAIITPCYNEQDILPGSLDTLIQTVEDMAANGVIDRDSFILCVDDCSTDATWKIIEKFHSQNPMVKGLRFAHNSGQQNALIAGLMTVMDHCDAAVTIDADLQDDPKVIKEMVDKYKDGAEVVFGVRSSRESDTWFKRTSARSFYRFQKWMGVESIYDHSEFRLMSSRAIRLLEEYGERNIFLRNIVVRIGLPTAIVASPRSPRTAGETKYSLSKMVSLSIDAITSFTAKPMRFIFMTGVLLVVFDIIIAIYALVSFFSDKAASGWTSLILSVWFLGGLILMGIGIVGEYIGKIYEEVKRRPRYAVRDFLLGDLDNDGASRGK